MLNWVISGDFTVARQERHRLWSFSARRRDFRGPAVATSAVPAPGASAEPKSCTSSRRHQAWHVLLAATSGVRHVGRWHAAQPRLEQLLADLEGSVAVTEHLTDVFIAPVAAHRQRALQEGL